MATSKAKLNQIDEYIAAFPVHTRELLKLLRVTIKKAAPDADEIISYNMPAYKFHGMIAWFAGYQHHVGFYPGASGIAHFNKEFSAYKWAKGSVQFPLDKPLPVKLITRIVNFKVKENLEKVSMKKKAKQNH